MKTYRFRANPNSQVSFGAVRRALPIAIALAGLSIHTLNAQSTNQASVPEQIQKLTEAMARTQAQVEQSQRELNEMREQVAALQRQLAQGGTSTAPAPSPPAQASSAPQAAPASTGSEIEDIREQQALQESQIATHEQSKVESESKYPVKLTGLILLNGFVNTRAVDMAATPTLALPGSGSTGAAVRQTVLGVDARGPHLFGAHSYADLRVDFDGTPQNSAVAGMPGYYSANSNSTLLRLRTAHAMLEWSNTSAYFALDRPVLSPDAPASLTAVSVPALAWSGNLWTWNPQAGVTQDIGFAGSRDLRLQAALIDVGDAPLTPATSMLTLTPATTAEQSRWPGVEARVALLGSKVESGGSHFGAGGYFSPHRISPGNNFDAWAGTLDARLALPAHFELTANSYRGLALGGLGGGAFKDFAYRYEVATGEFDFRPLDDAGGWAELKEKASERLEFNAAFGMDDVFAKELRDYAFAGNTVYQNLARNRTYTGNVIYSPSAYLLFSIEYRHLESVPVVGAPADSNIIGIGAGYKF
jgi:hypothetical protein